MKMIKLYFKTLFNIEKVEPYLYIQTLFTVSVYIGGASRNRGVLAILGIQYSRLPRVMFDRFTPFCFAFTAHATDSQLSTVPFYNTAPSIHLLYSNYFTYKPRACFACYK